MADTLNVQLGLTPAVIRNPSSNQENQVVSNSGPGNAILVPANLPAALSGLYGVPFPVGSKMELIKNGSQLRAACAPGPFITSPAVPASTTPQNNTTGQPVAVTVSGGTVTVIAVGGVTQTVDGVNVISGTFIVPVGGSITITYSVVPTWTWQAGQPTVLRVSAGVQAT